MCAESRMATDIELRQVSKAIREEAEGRDRYRQNESARIPIEESRALEQPSPRTAHGPRVGSLASNSKQS
jgi:hypothetical protein